MFAHHAYIGIGVGQCPVVGLFCSDLVVILRNEDVALDTSAYCYLFAVLFLSETISRRY